MKNVFLGVALFLASVNAFALDGMNFMISCDQKNPDMRAVILSSNSGSILGRKVAVTPPTVFLHDWNGVVGVSKLKVVSSRYEAAAREEIMRFSSENGSFADVRIKGVAENFEPGAYVAEVTLGIFAYGYQMRANSIACEALIDRSVK